MKYESFLKYHWKHVFASRWLERDYQHIFLLEWYTASVELSGLWGKGSRRCAWKSDSVMKHAASLRSIHSEDIWETRGVLFGKAAYCRWHCNKYPVLLISNHSVLLWFLYIHLSLGAPLHVASSPTSVLVSSPLLWYACSSLALAHSISYKLCICALL